MGRKHFQQFHNSEPRIKRCLRCLLNEKSEIIKKQNRKIDDLRHYLNEEEYRNEQLLDKFEERPCDSLINPDKAKITIDRW